jgi:hypothetical protein
MPLNFAFTEPGPDLPAPSQPLAVMKLNQSVLQLIPAMTLITDMKGTRVASAVCVRLYLCLQLGRQLEWLTVCLFVYFWEQDVVAANVDGTHALSELFTNGRGSGYHVRSGNFLHRIPARSQATLVSTCGPHHLQDTGKAIR